MLPTLFLSHGAPDLVLSQSPAQDFLSSLASRLERPQAILIISAHWETASPAMTAADVNGTIHDFRGFPAALYTLRFPAPGSPALAERAAGLLRQTGLSVTLDTQRRLDHGAWVPLLLAYPAADIPTVQLSVQPHLGPAHHLALGHALAPLREDGVLIIGSGSFTHNLREFFHGQFDREPQWVTAFADWFGQALIENRTDDLLRYRQIAPFAEKNHPTEEHLLPLYVAFGAAGEKAHAQRVHYSTDRAVLRLDAFAFTGQAADA
jgi:4,5-DOPA dioxygenase extradiol